MGNKRPRPAQLAAKLLAIRQHLRLSQPKMCRLLSLEMYHRISEYETGRREPTLMLLLRYARVANACLESIIDDDMDLRFHVPKDAIQSQQR